MGWHGICKATTDGRLHNLLKWESVLKVKDKVEMTLCDKIFTGLVVKIHRRNGWQGYVDVILDDDAQKIVIPQSFLRVVE